MNDQDKRVAMAAETAGYPPGACHRCGNEDLEAMRDATGDETVVCPVCGSVWEDCGDGTRRML